MSKSNEPLELESTFEMLADESMLNIQIYCEKGKRLNAQAVLDAVSEMLFTYYGISADQWNQLDDNKDLDS